MSGNATVSHGYIAHGYSVVSLCPEGYTGQVDIFCNNSQSEIGGGEGCVAQPVCPPNARYANSQYVFTCERIRLYITLACILHTT